MFSFVHCKDGNIKKDGTAFVFVSANIEGKRRYYKTILSLKKTEWDKTKKAPTNKASEEKRRIFAHIQTALNTLYLSGRTITESELLKVIQPQTEKESTETTLKDLFFEYSQNKDLSPSTREKYKYTYQHLTAYKKSVDFPDIDIKFLTGWDKYLNSIMQTQSTANQHKNLKCILNNAIRLGIIKSSPYNVFSIDRGKSKERDFLTDKELEIFENIKPLSKLESIVKDMYLCAVYTGLRYSDLTSITPQNFRVENGIIYISVTMQKTSKPLNVPVSEMFKGKAVPIFKKYESGINDLFFHTSNQVANKVLKTLSNRYGINKPLTMHTARHTTAMYLLNCGGRIELVSSILGHTNISTTQIYAKMLPNTIANELQNLFK